MYGRNAQYKRESMAIMATITNIEATKSALDDEASWPAWMSSSSLWLFPPSSRCCPGAMLQWCLQGYGKYPTGIASAVHRPACVLRGRHVCSSAVY